MAEEKDGDIRYRSFQRYYHDMTLAETRAFNENLATAEMREEGRKDLEATYPEGAHIYEFWAADWEAAQRIVVGYVAAFETMQDVQH